MCDVLKLKLQLGGAYTFEKFGRGLEEVGNAK